MATTHLTCRVCGKKYMGCRTAEQTDGVFRWQAVSCSPECGEIYLKRILESRKPTTVEEVEDDVEPVQKHRHGKIRKSVAEDVTNVTDTPVEADAETVAEPEE